jgi:hypothetical protein
MNTTELLKQASELEKKAYADYVASYTSAGIVALVQGGVSFEKAAEMMKQASENDQTIIARSLNAVAFEKAAEYIADLEARLSNLEKVAEEAIVEAKKNDESDPLNKLASFGMFSEEEIAMMAQMPAPLVEKVASINSRPEGMGSAVGIPREKTDPLLEFLLG